MIALRLAQRLPRALRVEWEDGLAANFTYVWLRDNTERRPSLLHLDLNSKPEMMDFSRKELSLVWPPFLSTNYSSEFLRDHSTIKISSCSHPLITQGLTVPWRVVKGNEPLGSFALKGHMASMEWGEEAHEAGTLWPQLQQLPSVCTVQPVACTAKVHLVDAVTALQLMSVTHPQQFNFLVSSPIEYEGEMFSASHRVATLMDGKVLAVAFNNELRSSEITVDCIEMFYRSLKTFNKICVETMHTLVLERDETLVVSNTHTLVGTPAQNERRLHIKIYD